MKNSDDTVEVLSVETNAPATGRGRGLAWLLLLLLLAAAIGGGAYLWRLEHALDARFDAIESRAASRSAAPAVAPAPAPDPRVDETLRALRAADQEIAGLNARVTQLGAELGATRAALELLGSADKRDWALAEAEYLLRLANQNLLMGREVRGALALLDAADEVLRAQDDPRLHAARAALARDRAGVAAVADFDVEGTWLRLAALGAQLPALVIDERSLEAARAARGPAPAAESGTGWWSRARAVLDRYIVVRQRSVALEPLLPLAEEQYLRVNLRLALEQAKLALLAAEPDIYRGALAEAAARTRSHFSAEAPANRAFLAEIERLASLDIAPALPDASEALRALRERDRGLAAPAPAPAAPAPDEG